MARKRKEKPSVQFYLTDKSKKPFAYCTIAESNAISIMLEEYGDLREIIRHGLILSDTERFIIETYIANGIYKPNLRIL
jgi:hypothetical protein